MRSGAIPRFALTAIFCLALGIGANTVIFSITTMGLLSLALAAIGLYGVILYSVSRRTREIGLLVALGATPIRILQMVCRHSFAMAGTGMLIGLALAFLATRPLAMFLVPGLSVSDPAALLAAVGVLIGVTLIATLGPAARALQVDPITTLRYE